MFYRKKMVLQIESIQENLEQLRKAFDVEEMKGRLQDTGELVSSAMQKIDRHDMAIEEMLEEWEELRGSRKELSLMALECKELVLLSAIQYEQLRALLTTAGEDNPFGRQIALSMKKMLEALQDKGIYLTGKTGEPVDYGLHEVIDTTDAQRPELHGMVARVYECGVLYKGQIIRKARVSAYKI